MSEPENTALLLLGHGSSKHPDSSRSVRMHTELLREQLGSGHSGNGYNGYAEVHCAFLKEEPLIDDALGLIQSDRVIIIPDFLAEGYFTRQVIPAQLKRSDTGKRMVYCPPVGTHPLMADLIEVAAFDVLGDWSAEETSLLVVGHGSGKNPCSKQTLLQHLNVLRERHAFVQIADLWLEEAPCVGAWQDEATQRQVIVLPFLLNDGQHGGWDIPAEMGISSDVTVHGVTHQVAGKEVRITPALGTSPRLVEVIRAFADLWGQ